MEKIINIDGRDIKLKVNGGFLLQYKIRYKSDALQDIMKLFNNINFENVGSDLQEQANILQNLDIELFYKLFHMMAKTANPDIEDNYVNWVSSFDNLPIFDLLKDIVELLMCSISSNFQKKTML